MHPRLALTGINAVAIAQRMLDQPIGARGWVVFERILVAVDGSETAMHGFAVAMALALERRAALDVLYVVDETPVLQGLANTYAQPELLQSLDTGLRAMGKKILADCETRAARAGLRIHPIIDEAVGEPVASVILKTAAGQHSQLIVLGSDGTSDVAASWSAPTSGTIVAQGATALAASDITGFKIVGSDGSSLLSIPVRQPSS